MSLFCLVHHCCPRQTSAEQAVRNSAVALRLPDPPALGANDTHDPPNSDLKDWPCVAPTNSFIYNGLCAVCSEEKPCLFDVWTDDAEVHNLAEKMPELVQEMHKTYTKLVFEMRQTAPYIGPGLRR